MANRCKTPTETVRCTSKTCCVGNETIVRGFEPQTKHGSAAFRLSQKVFHKTVRTVNGPSDFKETLRVYPANCREKTHRHGGFAHASSITLQQRFVKKKYAAQRNQTARYRFSVFGLFVVPDKGALDFS